MHTIEIPGTGLRVSKLIFGTASLFNAGTPRQRRHLLSSAVDAGFTHFDTAPYYGFGVAERDLATVLESHPHLTFTTKVGLYSPGGEDQSDVSVFLRKALGRVVRTLSRPVVDFTIAAAETALEGSLRRTGRERIDLYMLHEPDAGLVATEEWRAWLDRCVVMGKVRHFGMALGAGKLESFLDRESPVGQVVQVFDSLAGREADVLARHRLPMQITYGYVSAALREDPGCSVPDVLRAAVGRNRQGAVIVSSTKAGRVHEFPRMIEEPGDDR